MKTLNWLRVAVAAATLTTTGIVGVVAATVATASYGNVTATTAVNIRSGPGTNHQRLGVLYPGHSIPQTGPTSNGWVQVDWHGRQAWVSAQYVRGVSAAPVNPAPANPAPANPAPVNPAPATNSGSVVTTLYTTAYLNVRTGPSTSYARVTTLSKGAAVTTTGNASGRFVEINYQGTTRWVCADYLSSTAISTTNLESMIKYRARATTALMIRTSPGKGFTSLGDVPAGTILSMTGVTEGNVAQIVWNGSYKWVNKNYLQRIADASGAVTPSTPATTSTRYATAALDIRTSSGADSRTLSEVPYGTALEVTGVVENGRAQIIYQGAIRWVTARYLSATPPKPTLNTGGSKGLDGLQPNGKLIVHEVRAKFPQIRTMYGVRADPYPDHPSGLAVDIMLPNYKQNNALGWTIAKYFKDNAKQFGVKYIIFDQQIWNIERDREGWRKMKDRGSDNQNHKNHVHITVYK